MDVTQAETLADQICGCANREQHRRDVALLNEAFAAHREAAARDMRERAAKEAEDFWGVDSAADRIRALPLGSK